MMQKLIRIFLLFTILDSTFVHAQKFTLPVMPDTQVEVGANSQMYFMRFKWILEHKENIPFVLHVGDLVNFNSNEHWDNASAGYDMLDQNHIKYAIALGNHDTGAVGDTTGSAAPGNTNKNLRITEKFNRYFPPSRFSALRGSFEPGKSDNSFYTFKTGNLNWLVLSLEFCSRPEPIKWADSVTAAHPFYNVIIQTHFHLTSKGEINKSNAGYGDLSPLKIFDTFIKKHKNILLVLSGHVCGSALKLDKGEAGNKIYQILQNYQCWDKGGGYMRLLDIDVDKKTIDAKMYSPYYEKYKSEDSYKLTNVDFIQPQFAQH